MGRFLIPGCLLLCFMVTRSEGQQDAVRKFTEETCDSLIAVFLEDAPALSVAETTIFKSLNEDKEVNGFLLGRLERNRNRSSSELTAPESSYLVEFDVTRLSLAFDLPDSLDGIRATAEMAVFFRMVAPADEKVLKEKTYRLVNRKSYPVSIMTEGLPTGPAEKPSKGTGIVEPILLSGVTGIVIYLFYALRSR